MDVDMEGFRGEWAIDCQEWLSRAIASHDAIRAYSD